MTDHLGFTGNAAEVFDNGIVKILTDGGWGYAFRKVELVGKGFRCVENLCVGDRVLDDRTNGTGRVLEIFNNGTVKIAFDGGWGYSVLPLTRIGVALNCDIRTTCSFKN